MVILLFALYKMKIFCIFIQKYLVNSKKSSIFAHDFKKESSRDNITAIIEISQLTTFYKQQKLCHYGKKTRQNRKSNLRN